MTFWGLARTLKSVSETWGVGGRPSEDPDVSELARPHVARAIACLAEIMEGRGRQAQSAVMAAAALIKLANPDMDDPRVQKLVEEKFKALLDEARKRIEASRAGAIDA